MVLIPPARRRWMRINHSKAGKDYPRFGIKKGDLHYSWAFFRQGTIRSLTRPTRAQTTQNDFLVAVYTAADESLPAATCPEDMQTVADEVREAGEELRGRFDELPEGFQQGDTGQQMEERADAAEEWASAIEEAASTLQERLDEIEEWATYHADMAAWVVERPGGEGDDEVNEDTQDQPEDVDQEAWDAWVAARPEEPSSDEPEDLDEARASALADAIEEAAQAEGSW